MNHVNAAEYELRRRTSDQSFKRGEEYFRRGAVRSTVRVGTTTRAEVAGSAPIPYQVQIEWSGANIINAWCDCPYSYDDYCKHVVAAALAALRQPDQVEERQPLNEILGRLNRDQLQSVIIELARTNPSLDDQVYGLAMRTALAADPAAGSSEIATNRLAVDLAFVRHRVQSAFRRLHGMRASEAYWQIGGGVGEIAGIVDEVSHLLELGRSEETLTTLDTVTSEYLSTWAGLDDSDGELSGFLWELGDLWAEVLLSLDLSKQQREDLFQKIDEYSADLMDYGLEDAFYPALDALEYWWDDSKLQAAMRGETFEGDEGDLDLLIPIRLKVLARQQRFDEYINLARAGGQIESYLTMLVQLERFDEAVRESFTLCQEPDTALRLAVVLQDRGLEQQALTVGRHGLTLPGSKRQLAAWVRDAAEATGDTELALKASVIAFESAPGLEPYLRVQENAGSDWPEYRERLLDNLRTSQTYYPSGEVEVFLHEGLVSDAIETVSRRFSSDSLIALVAREAIESDPDWVIDQSVRRADGIMESGRSADYDEATEWMELAKSAYISAGRHREWNELLQDRLERHHRKYKLRPMLEQLVD